LVPIKAAQLIQVVNLRKSYGTMKIELCNYWLCKCTVQSAKTGVQLESRYKPCQWIGTLKYSNGSVATRTFQSVAHTCGKRMELDWATGSSANEWGQKNHTAL
jgi:hypothetical protein